ncbi:serine-threonine kinase STK5 [Canna indica]|uniref:non-specific serine/threonine protein kinase n=1 Tax=Canna indica TaxID=4628 RepID=A0AAQ3KWY2_9LILI|nr:serine-threonine kinase STK5 [Canna indica]
MEHRSTILMQRYELVRLLGQGTFAKVYHAKSLRTGQSVALKMIDKDKVMKNGLVEQIKREISVMRLVRHPNIVHLFEVMASKYKIYFVMEYAKGGELFAKVAKGRLREDTARKYFQQLISAVDYCHSRGVYHRDLKPENLLLDEHGNLKVSDFGLSALAESKRSDGLLHTTCGTPAYVAPEVITRTGYDGAKADIWSCGVILFVLLSGYLPFHDSNVIEVYKKISKGDIKYPSWFSSDARKLLTKILDPNPLTRISIAKIKENKWFRKGFIDKKLKNEEETAEIVPSDVAEVFNSYEITNEGKQEPFKVKKLNAFDVIALAAGFDLSRLFEQHDQKKEVRFTSKESVSAIVSKLEEVAKNLKLKFKKNHDGLLKIEGLKEGRKGVLTIETEILEVTPSFHFVEIKKSNGDTLEYQRLLKENVRPALKDIVWAWQDE